MFFIRVLVTWYFKNRCVNCFYPRSVVKNNPPRKAVAKNLGNFMLTCCFSFNFLRIYIYITPQGPTYENTQNAHTLTDAHLYTLSLSVSRLNLELDSKFSLSTALKLLRQVAN